MSPPLSSSEVAPAPPCIAAETKPGDAWFESEVQPHMPALRAYLQRRYPTLSDVDDVVQESSLVTFLAWQKGKITSAKGFLYTVASRATANFFRRRRRVAPVPVHVLAETNDLVDDANVTDSACTADELALLTDALADLPVACREIMVRRLFDQQTPAEIALALGLAPATVRVQLTRGMKRCTDYLRKRGVGS